MISRMQLPREMYGNGGLTSLREARSILERHAPTGEFLAYINSDEAALLKSRGGSGEVANESGIKSYGFLKKIFKPVAKVLDKIVPNEIKPALPFIAAALPFMAPALLPTIGSLGGLITNSTLQGAIGGGLVNLASQAAQEGAAERGPNLFSTALAGVGGALSTPGAGEALRGGQVLGVDELGQAVTRSQAMPYLESNYPGLDFSTTNLTGQGAQYGLPVTQAPTSFLDSAQNLATETAAKGADVFKAGQEADSIFSKEFLTAAAPGQIGAAGDLAYNAAWKANEDYKKQQAAIGSTIASNKQEQINYIRSAMKSAGFTEDETNDALRRSGFNQGGYVGFAKGGIMDLGGNEMDYRAKGGFVPIGKKERADDVPARLSKNEFVFTAKAVRNAGNGDIRKGAKKMYQIMNQLEAMA
jgi:hypothetical protein